MPRRHIPQDWSSQGGCTLQLTCAWQIVAIARSPFVVDSLEECGRRRGHESITEWKFDSTAWLCGSTKLCHWLVAGTGSFLALMKCVTMGQYASVCTFSLPFCHFARVFGSAVVVHRRACNEQPKRRMRKIWADTLATINSVLANGGFFHCAMLCINKYVSMDELHIFDILIYASASNMFHRHRCWSVSNCIHIENSQQRT